MTSKEKLLQTIGYIGQAVDEKINTALEGMKGGAPMQNVVTELPVNPEVNTLYWLKRAGSAEILPGVDIQAAPRETPGAPLAGTGMGNPSNPQSTLNGVRTVLFRCDADTVFGAINAAFETSLSAESGGEEQVALTYPVEGTRYLVYFYGQVAVSG